MFRFLSPGCEVMRTITTSSPTSADIKNSLQRCIAFVHTAGQGTTTVGVDDDIEARDRSARVQERETTAKYCSQWQSLLP